MTAVHSIPICAACSRDWRLCPESPCEERGNAAVAAASIICGGISYLDWTVFLSANGLDGLPLGIKLSEEVAFLRMKNALIRGDRSEALRLADEMRERMKKKSATRHIRITKWDPGDHFYCLGEKFDSVKEARAHAHTNGYVTDGMVLVTSTTPPFESWEEDSDDL